MITRMTILLVIAYCLMLYSQELYIEALFDGEFESEEQSEIIEELYYVLEHPLNVNTASYYELQKIPWISPIAAQHLIRYRQEHKIRDITELKNIDGFRQHYYIIRKFLTVKSRPLEHISVTGRHRVVQKSVDIFDDLSLKIYNRFYLKNKQIDSGILVEKDAGESDYADLVHGFASWQAPSHPVKVTMGQFKAKAAQGLVLWGSFGLRKGSNVLAPARQRGQGISPFMSSDENSALTGAAVEWSGKKTNAFMFASHNPIDAGTAADSIISLPNTGLHTTPLEKSRKNAAYKEAAGGRMQLRTNRFDVGMTMLTERYSLPTAQHLAGKAAGTVWGVDYEARSQLFNFYGETAIKNNAFAHQYGIWFEHENTSLVLNFRAFDANFHHANAFAFSSVDPNNERGVYVGGNHQFNNFQLSTYIDLFQQPYKMIDDLQPGSAFDFLTRLAYDLTQDIQISLRYKKRNRWEDEKHTDIHGNTFKHYVQNEVNTLRLQMDIQPNQSIELRSRFESAFQKDSWLYSSSIYQQLCIQNQHSRLYARWTFFDVPDYALRLYQYENDVPGVMNNRLFYGRGSCFFIIFARNCGMIRLYTKFDYTNYNLRPGMQLAEPLTNMQISIQADWKIN